MSHYVIVNQAEKKKRHKKFFKRILCAVILLIIIAIGIALWVYWRSMTPTILDIASVKVQSEATRAINEAVLAVFSGDVNYADMVVVEKNKDNDIVMLSANSSIVNNLARNTSLLTQTKINKLFEEAISIPIGSLSGVPLLNEVGPNVSISVSPIGSVLCTFVSEFVTAGINQTLHRIFLNVESKVDLIVPTMHREIEINTPVLVCETVIVGQVPQTFLQGGFVLGSAS